MTKEIFHRPKYWDCFSKPQHWLKTAEDLRCAYDVLWESQDTPCDSELGSDRAVVKTALMLLGFSLENLLKGIILDVKPEMKEGSRLSKVILNHNLVELANLAGFRSESAALVDELTHLTQFAIYAGRYPVAKDAKSETYQMWIPSHVVDQCCAFWGQLHKYLTIKYPEH